MHYVVLVNVLVCASCIVICMSSFSNLLTVFRGENQNRKGKHVAIIFTRGDSVWSLIMATFHSFFILNIFFK